MRPEAALAKRIRIAVVKDGRARVVPNFVGKMVSWALIKRALRERNVDVLAQTHPVDVGLGLGSADLVGVIRPTGRVIGLEVKTDDGALSLEQTLWLTQLRRWGGFAAVVRSPVEAISAIDRAVAGAFE